MLLDRFLFKIPAELLAAVARGEVYRIGATLRDRLTGRIVRHLQETSLLSQLAQNALGGNPLGLLQGGQLASAVAATAQLQQVTGMLSTLQLLSGASLAASVVGVGVSAAGFALVMHRLHQLEGHFAGLQREVLANRLTAERIDVRLATYDHARTEHLLQRAEEAWLRADAERVWRDLEGPLDQEQRYWRGLVGGQPTSSIFRDPRFSLEQAAAAYESALTLAATRVQTLLLLEELAAARHHALEFQRWHDQALSGLRPVAIAAARCRQLAESTGLTEADARSQLLQRGQQLIDGAREIELHLVDRPVVIQILQDRGIRGRDYVEALRTRRDVPVLTFSPS